LDFEKPLIYKVEATSALRYAKNAEII